jgi:hypothetical protein
MGSAGGSVEDPALVSGLLKQLAASSHAHSDCRQQLLRCAHHTPVILTNPLGGAGNTAWQLACAGLALLCVAACAQWQRGRRELRAVKQHAQVREAAWRRVVTGVRAKVQQQLEQSHSKESGWQQQLQHWQEKEAAWQQGMQALDELAQQREVALLGDAQVKWAGVLGGGVRRSRAQARCPGPPAGALH